MICDLTKPINPGESKTVTLVMTVSETQALCESLVNVLGLAKISELVKGDSAAKDLSEVRRLYFVLSRAAGRAKHYLIIGEHIKDPPMGCCYDQSDVLREEPGATFVEVDKDKCPICLGVD